MMLQGPITGGNHGWAFGRPLLDLTARGYIAEEFFLTGTAVTYRPVPGFEWGRDGVWHAEPKGSMPFKTRFLVYRPADASAFNGVVVTCWNNVTAGYELFHGESPEILGGGYAYVGASVQRVGVHGFPADPQGLVAWDPERYGELSIPSDEGSYDIFAQIGRAVGPQRDRSGIDPLGGLNVKKVIAIGASQSAGRLATYVNAILPLGRVFDAFMLQIYFGAGAQLEGDRILVPSERPRLFRGTNLMREVDVPVMIVNSELEAIACHRVRQPDTDRFVNWESAGTTHVPVQTQLVRNRKYEREFGVAPVLAEGQNRIALTPYYDAALHALTPWVDAGIRPPSQPLIEFTGGNEPKVVRDQHGIAKGGIRLPQVEVPVATNSSIPINADYPGSLRGSNAPFGAAKLTALYGNEATYLERFEAAAHRAVRAGAMLARDVEPAMQEAAQEYRRSWSAGA
ncbi:MAG TPA: alpha/beta hydrolase domain-containing protein [Polyangiales bacterium]|nr:alpha/beta hydrolase domain-containing protein [Polyangiales bacterium]